MKRHQVSFLDPFQHCNNEQILFRLSETLCCINLHSQMTRTSKFHSLQTVMFSFTTFHTGSYHLTWNTPSRFEQYLTPTAKIVDVHVSGPKYIKHDYLCFLHALQPF